MKSKPQTISMPKILQDPSYKGKHIILIAGKVFTAKTGTEALKILRKARKEFPKAIPEIAFMSKANSLTV